MWVALRVSEQLKKIIRMKILSEQAKLSWKIEIQPKPRRQAAHHQPPPPQPAPHTQTHTHPPHENPNERLIKDPTGISNRAKPKTNADKPEEQQCHPNTSSNNTKCTQLKDW